MNDDLWVYEAGIKISVPILTLFDFPRHVAVLTDWENPHGERLVLTSTPKCGVHLATLRQFANGKLVRMDGYPSELEPDIVMWRGYNVIGTPYREMNCDQVVEFVHGRPVRSEQIEAVIGWAITGALVWVGTQALSRA